MKRAMRGFLAAAAVLAAGSALAESSDRCAVDPWWGSNRAGARQDEQRQGGPSDVAGTPPSVASGGTMGSGEGTGGSGSRGQVVPPPSPTQTVRQVGDREASGIRENPADRGPASSLPEKPSSGYWEGTVWHGPSGAGTTWDGRTWESKPSSAPVWDGRHY